MLSISLGPLQLHLVIDCSFLPVDRVKWFCDRTAQDRAREEKEILEEEFGRSIMSFKRYAEVWLQLAEAKGRSPGSAAYAHKQCKVFSNLANACEVKWVKAQAAAAELASNEA